MQYLIKDKLEGKLRKEWLDLFIECFNTTPLNAKLMLKKYHLNKSLFCLVLLDGVIVASYSGLDITSNLGLRLFLSCDTMSNGKIKGGSYYAAKYLYDFLDKKGFQVVCGFPNKKIEGLRVKRLGWIMSEKLNLYVRPKIIPNRNFFDICSDETYNILRPKHGFWGRAPFLFQLYGYPRTWSMFEIRLSNRRLGFPYLCLSDYFPSLRKNFGFRVLDITERDTYSKFMKNIILSERSIDVP